MNPPRTSRLLAILALALLMVAGAVAVWLVLTNPLWAISFAATALLTAAVVWRLLFSRHPASAIFYQALALVLFALLLLESLFFLQGNFRLVVAFALMAAAAVAIGSRLDTLRTRLDAHSSLVRSGERPYLIINPKSGSGRALKQDIPKLAEAAGIQVLQLEPGGSLTELITRAIAGGATQLGISGGDGSLGLAASAAMQHNLPLVVLPGGTRCHFARDIGLDPDHMAAALPAFSGTEKSVDAAEINGRVFLNNASFGIYGDIVGQPGYRERKLRTAMNVFEQRSDNGYSLRFKDGEGAEHHRAVMLLIGVNRYETINFMELGTRNRLDEGLLQMTAVYNLEPGLLKSIASLKLSSQHRGINQWVGTQFVVSGPAPLTAGIDGELVQLDSPARLRIVPGALRLLVPRDAPHRRRTLKRRLANLTNYALRGELPNE
jgi:diacylglycerol kinase family enzyme